MNARDALWAIDATLKDFGFKETGPGKADYEGPLKVHGKPVDIRISIPDVKFGTKPKISLLDRSQVPLDTLAHVEDESGICYASGAGLPVDLYKPGQAILRVLEEAQRTLELSFRGRAHREIVDEYQLYWHPKLGVRCLLPRESPVAVAKGQLFFATLDDGAEFMCLSAEAEVRGYEARYPRTASVWYVNKPIGPARGVGAPSDLSQLEIWLGAQPGIGTNRWDEAFKCLARRETLFIAAPNALVGLQMLIPRDLEFGINKGTIRKSMLPTLLRMRAKTVKLDRLTGVWCNIEDLTARNNADPLDLRKTSIALVGCGTIGSHLARMLVQSGAGCGARLSLFDNQRLSEGNIGRHLLGFRDIGKEKATGLKTELERFHPQVNVDAWVENALEWWPRLADHDLVIDATGDWNVQSALNEYFLDAEDSRVGALLHAWVFMNGAGAQSFLNLRDENGCFRCLKPLFDGPWRYPAGNEKDELNLQPASCGDGAFVPFTVEAPVMAASLANRSALDWANGRSGARLRTVAVDPARGRYQKPVTPSALPQCPACGSRRVKK